MSNANYLRGVRWERQVMAEYKKMGYTVLRTAGSHGFADLVAIHQDRPVLLIQCKTGKRLTKKQATSKVKRFMANPPLGPSAFYHQVLSVYAMKDKARVEGSL